MKWKKLAKRKKKSKVKWMPNENDFIWKWLTGHLHVKTLLPQLCISVRDQILLFGDAPSKPNHVTSIWKRGVPQWRTDL